ncbi:MAG: hypothetical protein K6E54_07135 [Bacteroidaceae bacterium]|nr:hypothetical protein [Bacteroidaceae bacterium]
MQGLREKVQRWDSNRKVAGHHGLRGGEANLPTVVGEIWSFIQNHQPISFLHAPYPEGFQRPERCSTDGYDLLGTKFRPDGHQGCLEEQGSLAKVCHT